MGSGSHIRDQDWIPNVELDYHNGVVDVLYVHGVKEWHQQRGMYPIPGSEGAPTFRSNDRPTSMGMGEAVRYKQRNQFTSALRNNFKPSPDPIPSRPSNHTTAGTLRPRQAPLIKYELDQDSLITSRSSESPLEGLEREEGVGAAVAGGWIR